MCTNDRRCRRITCENNVQARMRPAKERVAVKGLVRDEKDSRKEEQTGTR